MSPLSVSVNEGQLITKNHKSFFELTYEFDLLLILSELLLLLGLLSVGGRFVSNGMTTKSFYDEFLTFCQYNNLSLAEIGTFVSLFFGFIIFDIFMSFVQEDGSDIFFIFIFIFVFNMFVFLFLAIDVQYYYLISSISGGDLTTRVIFFDFVNNFLCLLRIFFC